MIMISNFLIPSIILGIVVYGLIKKVPVYDAFVEGAKNGLTTVIQVMPTLIGLMVAVGVLRASGFLEFLASIANHMLKWSEFPGELVPLVIVKMFSSSAAIGLLLDVYKAYGVDSLLGNIASVMMSSTETIFYTMSIYYMTVKVTKTRWTLAGALIATMAGVVASVILTS